MSTSIATSPDSGHSSPRTPHQGQAPSVQPDRSSPVGKLYKYFLLENRERYQKFSYDDRFLLGPFDDKSKFLQFLNVKLPKSVPDTGSRGKESFLTLANNLAKFIKDKHFPERDTLVFQDMRNKAPGHVTDTRRKPDITAAFEGHWKDGVVPWPFIRLAGGTASAGKSQKGQAISYLHYLLLARPDLYVAQGLLSSDNKVIFLFGVGGEGIRHFDVEWKDPDFNNLLYAFIYRLYEPGHFVDSSYIKTELDKETTATYTINITHQGRTKECPGFYSIYSRNPFGTRTHVLSNPNFKVEGNDLTVLKDQFCRVERRFEELRILNEYVHKPERVPGVVVAAYGKRIPLSEERCKHRLGLGENGSPFMSIPTLSKVLETLFDVLEVLRYLRLHRRVLHRDISSGNVLYIENSSERSLPPKVLSVSPPQEAETNGLPLCYAKYLLGKRYGTPIFMARAVERTGPVSPILTKIPRIPKVPDVYAKAHPDRVQSFPDSEKMIVIDPELLVDNESQSGWRHELENDAESVFWLLLYWAMVVQPENCPKEKIDAESWIALNGNHESRQELIMRLPRTISSNLVHSLYTPLQPLIKGLAAILVIDSHWLPASNPRKDPFYITEAFQRLILQFIIDNRDKEFMDHRVETTFRKVQGIQASNARSSTFVQSLDATTREGVISGTDDVEMDECIQQIGIVNW